MAQPIRGMAHSIRGEDSTIREARRGTMHKRESGGAARGVTVAMACSWAILLTFCTYQGRLFETAVFHETRIAVSHAADRVMHSHSASFVVVDRLMQRLSRHMAAYYHMRRF